MWNRKELTRMALAAVATFTVTTAIGLPRLVQATPDAQAAKALSPVLKVGECEVVAEAESAVLNDGTAGGTSIPIGSNSVVSSDVLAPASGITLANGGLPGQVTVTAGQSPAFRLKLKNPTAAETRVAFNATLATTNPWGRGLNSPTQRWIERFDLVLQPGETREFEMDPKLPLAAMTTYLVLENADDVVVNVRAITFSSPINFAATLNESTNSIAVRTAAK